MPSDTEVQGRATPGWGEMLRGGNLLRCLVVSAGMILHAINTFIVVTVMPSIVRDIGGMAFFAWSTTLYVVASLLGGAVCARLLHRLGAQGTYRLALVLFGLGTAACALAPNMAVLLAARLLQGLGAGLLSALSFSMVRLLFPAHLWSRALSVISLAWGVATLAGPAVGGVFAEYGAWRWAFWTTLALVPLMALLVAVALPRDLARAPAPRLPMALLNLGVLAGSVMAVSVGGTSGSLRGNLIGLAVAALGMAWFFRLEATARLHLLPRGGTNPATPLGAAYGAMMMLAFGVNTEIFVPYFLQVLHGVTPLHAGYLSALMSAGWTTGAVLSSGGGRARVMLSMRGGPLVMALSIAVLSAVMPVHDEGGGLVAVIGVCLAAMGLGIGFAWPHLGPRVFAFAADNEKDIAAASITIVLMTTYSFGSALGGVVTNLAGIAVPGGAAGASDAAGWLFTVFTVPPLVAAMLVRRLLRTPLPGAG
ncbi:MAG: MFS transporter [Acetobacteraceae bacterium]|nr:MFS transporter [Acetobacteraceae bacterium]